MLSATTRIVTIYQGLEQLGSILTTLSQLRVVNKSLPLSTFCCVIMREFWVHRLLLCGMCSSTS